MYAMQYGVNLPSDYDMQIMRDIVKRNGHLLDDRKGLGFKAYLMQERGVLGSPVNHYGSFYLWNDASAMAHFLVGGGAFDRIIRGLGRLAVDQWVGIACVAGPSRSKPPVFASRRVTRLSRDLDLQPDGLGLAILSQARLKKLAEFAKRDHVHTAALAVDPNGWDLLRFVAWDTAQEDGDDATERYEILHVSTPEILRLPTGRVW